MVEYNGDSNLDKKEDIKFVDVDLPWNKLSVQLLAYDFTARFKKRHIVININNETGEVFKAQITQEKKLPIKKVDKKSFKAYVPIFGPDI